LKQYIRKEILSDTAQAIGPSVSHHSFYKAPKKAMNTEYLSFSISIAIISWMVVNSVLVKTRHYQKLSNMNLIKSRSVKKMMGLRYFKFFVKNTVFKYFNQKLSLKSKTSILDLNKLREEMLIAELNHCIGFGFVSIFAVVKFIEGSYVFGATIMVVNIVLILYPFLIQQENKNRIDSLIVKYS
jgi:hypothetical protein